jgi:hypothetical protein
MPCIKKRGGKLCDFELMALPSKLKKGHIHVYAHSKHSDHPFLTKGQCGYVLWNINIIIKKNYRTKSAN